MEMIKGIEGHGYHDELVVPIIENTAYEGELTESFTKAVCYHMLDELMIFICYSSIIASNVVPLSLICY